MSSTSSGSNAPLFLGLDCGGTRTVALLVDDRAECLARLEAGPANMRLMSDRQLALHFRHVAARLPRPAAVGIGMAGVLEAPERARVRHAAQLAWPNLPAWTGNDLETALAAADAQAGSHPGARVVIISGTGSCCYGRGPSGETAKAGGWGHVLGDRASGYHIALQALRQVMRAFDLTGRWPKLGEHFLRQLLLNTPNELVDWANAASKTDLAALAVGVFDAAARGDRIAKPVVVAAASSLCQAAVACATRLVKPGRQAEFFLTGGVLLKQSAFAASVKRQLRRLWPHCLVRPLAREAAWGAVVHATDAWLASRSAAVRPPGAATPDPAHPISLPLSPSPNGFLPTSSDFSPTEQRNPRSRKLDRMPLARAVGLMLSEDARIPAALLRERARIEKAIRLIVRSLRRGGRLFYIGAGTSGRLGVLDASECPPTFSTPPDLVQGIMAGGQLALWSSAEGAEDDAEAGAQAVAYRGVRAGDVLIGIAASGRTPFVWGGLQAAQTCQATTMLLCFNPHLVIPPQAKPDLVIAPVVGPEILTGSSRLKAGTATKLLLNIFTTLAMVQLGKVRENLMIDLNPSNAKLRDRAERIVMELTRASRSEAHAALATSAWVIQRAITQLSRRRRS
jgi:N-acetylmuramic acid 6-phosphate etherase